MKNYVIFTDSACDMELSTLEKWNVKCIDLTLKFESEEKIWSNSEIAPKTFYQKMRDGGVAKTSAVNSEKFKQAFEEEIKKGNDILYLAFSTGLSTTCNSGAFACKALSEVYPDSKIITVDSLAKRLDTINYELVCIIGKRVTRVFKSGGETVAMRSLIGSN